MRFFVGAFLLFFVFTATAIAAEPVGTVASVRGNAVVERGGKKYKLPQNAKMYNGDSVVTGRDTFVKLLMKDDSLLTVGERSNFKIENFSTGKTRTGSFRLWFGKVRAIVSKYTAGPTDYKFTTPTAVAGVRGTHLLVAFDYASKKTTLSVLEGEVGFRSSSGKNTREVRVGALQQSVQQGRNEASGPTKIKPSSMQKIQSEISEQTSEPDDPANDDAEGSDAAPGSTESATGTSGDEADEGDEGSEGDADDSAEDDQGAFEEPDAIDRADDTVRTNDGTVQEQQLPTQNPAAETGIRVRW